MNRDHAAVGALTVGSAALPTGVYLEFGQGWALIAVGLVGIFLALILGWR